MYLDTAGLDVCELGLRDLDWARWFSLVSGLFHYHGRCGRRNGSFGIISCLWKNGGRSMRDILARSIGEMSTVWLIWRANRIIK
jgi:hypothetical protein